MDHLADLILEVPNSSVVRIILVEPAEEQKLEDSNQVGKDSPIESLFLLREIFWPGGWTLIPENEPHPPGYP